MHVAVIAMTPDERHLKWERSLSMRQICPLGRVGGTEQSVALCRVSRASCRSESSWLPGLMPAKLQWRAWGFAPRHSQDTAMTAVQPSEGELTLLT